MFKVKAGTKVIAVPRSSYAVNGWLKMEKKVTKKEADYFREDISIDPFNPGGAFKTIGHYYAKLGYYGFQLKSKDWDTMLVHMNDVEVL